MIVRDLGPELGNFNSFGTAAARPVARGGRSRISGMNIHQVSVSYVQEQDRLIIRINGKEGGELRAWLTRRLALALMPILHRTTAEQIQKVAGPALPAANLDEQRGQLLTAFQKEAALRTGDFETPYQNPQGPGGMPSGPEPLLLTEVKVTLMGNGQLRLQLFEKLPGQNAVRNFQVMMDPQLSNGLIHLLHQGLTHAQWLQVPAGPAVEALEASLARPAEPAELAADLDKPKYLN